MAATINTNIASINAQRNLSLSGQSLNTTMQRLSSGLRVNSAKDDAAGLAIAERMNTQVKGLTVAARNANDGISLAQTAEGALGKVGDMLQRMRELAVQASNATNSASDRKALQAEVKQLSAEIDRVAKQTNFNGQKILDGSFAGAVFQVGANSGDNVTLGALADTRANMVSNINYATTTLTFDTNDTPTPAIADFDQAIAAGTLSIQVGDPAVLPAISLEGLEPANSSLERLGQVITAINNKTADTGVTAYMTLKEGTQEYSIAFMSARLDENNVPMEVSISGLTVATTGIVGTGTPIPQTGLPAIVTAATNYAGGATATDTSDFRGLITGDTRVDLTAALTTYDSAVTAATDDTGRAAAITALKGAYDTAIGALPAATPIVIDDTMHQLNQRGVDDIDVTTQEGAWIALKKIDSAVDQINGARATLGAMQARFENAVNNIDIQVENLSAARGRIMDTDFAVETANLSRTQILQQAGTAMVAQANQIPQNVLQLLQG